MTLQTFRQDFFNSRGGRRKLEVKEVREVREVREVKEVKEVREVKAITVANHRRSSVLARQHKPSLPIMNCEL